MQLHNSLNLKSVGNARHLGGYTCTDGKKVKDNLILRTANLNNISREDIDILLSKYNLGTVIDLRTSVECKESKDTIIPGVKYVNIHIINEELMKEFDEKQKEMLGGYDISDVISGKCKLTKEERIRFLDSIMDMDYVSNKMYILFLEDDEGKKGYRKFFKELIELPEGKSVLYHCSQGKDRTGVASMLLLSVLGVDNNDIIDDFMLTNVYNDRLIQAERFVLKRSGLDDDKVEEYMPIMDKVREDYMENVLEYLCEVYGSVTEYVKDMLSITDDEIKILKEKFRE